MVAERKYLAGRGGTGKTRVAAHTVDDATYEQHTGTCFGQGPRKEGGSAGRGSVSTTTPVSPP
jgi:hypothetical protein